MEHGGARLTVEVVVEFHRRPSCATADRGRPWPNIVTPKSRGASPGLFSVARNRCRSRRTEVTAFHLEVFQGRWSMGRSDEGIRKLSLTRG